MGRRPPSSTEPLQPEVRDEPSPNSVLKSKWVAENKISRTQAIRLINDGRLRVEFVRKGLAGMEVYVLAGQDKPPDMRRSENKKK